MNTTPVTDNITQLTRLHFVNAFLVREDDGLTLIDTTVGGGADDLIKASEKAGAPIRRIVLTHGHVPVGGEHVTGDQRPVAGIEEGHVPRGVTR